jgi:hypothetical protein
MTTRLAKTQTSKRWPIVTPVDITEEDIARFWAKVALPDARGCLVWTGPGSGTGYGKFRRFRRSVFAHRFAYMALVGPIADGLVLDHLCRNRACVRPDHLDAVTQRVNVLRGESPAACHAVATHCPAGHAYNKVNTLVSKRGSRLCRACHRDKERSRRAANRDAINARNRAARIAEAERNGYAAPVAPADRTHCPQGHPYDDTNTLRDPDGHRHCRTCHRQGEQARRDRLTPAERAARNAKAREKYAAKKAAERALRESEREAA